jgi:ergothioneine biosynthesis protein EgtB
MSRSDAQAKLIYTLQDYRNVRQASCQLASQLTEQDMQLQSMPDASPTKWHLAHTSWAFETFLLKPHLHSYQVFQPEYEYLFNSYYNAIGEQFSRPHRGLLSRPSSNEVYEYRNHIDRHMEKLLNNGSNDLVALVRLMINHEQQHQELMLTDILHAFSHNPLYPAYQKVKTLVVGSDDVPPPMTWTSFAAGLYSIGHNNEDFYFDNEGPQHQFYLEPFQLANRLVTCGEYLDFMLQGGYQESSFWLSEAWYQLQQTQSDSPLYWIKRKNQWFLFTLAGLVPIDLNAPVSHISFFEANAYAASVAKRLPTEQEWEVASRTVEQPVKTNNTSLRLFAKGASGSELKQMFAELWQWTSSSYNAYPGFKPNHGAIGEYNGKFMVNQYVLRGGSFVTPAGHIRPSYRNFFYPDAKWQFTGIRLAESL